MKMYTSACINNCKHRRENGVQSVDKMRSGMRRGHRSNSMDVWIVIKRVRFWYITADGR